MFVISLEQPAKISERISVASKKFNAVQIVAVWSICLCLLCLFHFHILNYCFIMTSIYPTICREWPNAMVDLWPLTGINPTWRWISSPILDYNPNSRLTPKIKPLTQKQAGQTEMWNLRLKLENLSVGHFPLFHLLKCLNGTESMFQEMKYDV